MFNFGGGMLTGAEIERQIKKGNISITPFDESCINPNSINLKLHPQLLVYKRNSIDGRKNIIPEVKQPIEKNENNPDNGIIYTNNGNPCRIVNTLDEAVKRSSIYDSYSLPEIDMNKDNETIEFEIPEEGYVLQPGVLYIGRTVERTSSNKFIPMINGRSSGGRLGISIHVCAGFGDIGFDGTWTLEITAVEPVRIYPNCEIAQVCYFKPCGSIKRQYKGRYLGQVDATASRYFKGKNYENTPDNKYTGW